MLVTNLNHELAAYPFRRDSGTKAWRAVSLELPNPYVFISYACKDGRIWISQSSILWRDDDVISVCEEFQSQPNSKIVQIALLEPPRNSNQKQWRMRRVKEIWTVKSHSDHQRRLLYIGTDGVHMSSIAEIGPLGFFELEKMEYEQNLIDDEPGLDDN